MAADPPSPSEGAHTRKAASAAGKKPPRSAATRKKPARAAGEGTRAAKALPVVGIGASAGGLEAFSELLEHLAPNTGMAFVLIPHLAPGQASMLPDLLAKKTSMPVLPVADARAVEPDHVYVLSPDKDVVLFGGKLSLVERTKVSGLHLPIDYFFRSLATDQGRRAIGIVLSGAASDGSLGLAAIKAEGGFTMAQDPATARYDGMPRSAIAAGCVDLVLSPSAIAAELARLGSHPYLAEAEAQPKASDDQSLFAKIFVVLNSVFGVDFSSYKMPTIRRRVERRMALYRLRSLQEYVDYLTAHPGEIEDLYQDILIMVTDFFREPEAFALLRSLVLPRLFEDKPEGAAVRVWVPGCATGEEAYSVAMELAEHQRIKNLGYPVKLFATDINERDIARARAGMYQTSRLANVPPAYLRRYFTRTDSGHEVRKEIRDLCVFARHDVTRDAPFSHIDFISCRNLLIYLGPTLQERVLPMFHYALRPGGMLMLGSAESVGSSADLFAALDRKHKLYIRRQTPSRLPVEFAYPSSLRTDAGAAVPAASARPATRAEKAAFDPLRLADSLVMSEHAPAGVVINEAFAIIQFRGSTHQYLANAPGAPSVDLLAMAREGLEADVRQAVEEALATGRRSVRRGVRVRGPERMLHADVLVYPLRGSTGELHFLVLFQPSAGKASESGGDEQEESAETSHEMLLLRSELEASRDHLQALITEKDLAVEELRAANEEIQSGNEELQSINEELETAKEELQSTNEELRTVNEELESRNLQLSLANDDLSSLLTGIRLPIVMVDRELRLRRHTPEAAAMFSVAAADVGRPIDDLRLRFEMPDLGAVLREVIETVVPFQRDIIDGEGRWSSLRVRPFQTAEGRIDGAILTLFDVDEVHRSLERVADHVRFSEALQRVGTLLRDARSRPRPLAKLLEEAARAEGADSASLMLREGGVWRTAFGYLLQEQDIGQAFDDDAFPHAALAAAARSPVAISHAAEDKRVNLEIVRRLGLGSVLVAPVLAGGEVAGVLVFNWHSTPIKLVEAQIDFADKVAVLTGLAMEADAAGSAAAG